MASYGEKLKELRKKKGFTQEELAKWLSKNSGQKVNQIMIVRWENGYSKIPLPKFLLAVLKELKG